MPESVRPAESEATTHPGAVHPVDERLPARRLVPAALQHIAAMYAGVVAPPLIIGPACGLDARDQTFLIAASLLVAGAATMLQTLGLGRFVGNRLPFVNAASSAGIGPMLAIADQSHGTHRLPTILGAVMIAGAFCLLVGPFFGRLMRFFPHQVIGVVITLIGVTLIPVPVQWARGGSAAAPDFNSLGNLALAGFTLVVIIAMQRFFTGFLKQIALLLGMLVGTLAAIPFGKVNTGAFTNAATVALPTPFRFGAPEFQPAAIVSMCIVMLVLMTESSAGMLAIGEITDRTVDRSTVTRGLRTDGVATFLGSMFGSCATSAFAQNVGVVQLTRVRSRFVVASAGLVLVVLGLFPKLGAAVALVPMPVLGGAGIVLFGTIAVGGIRSLVKINLDDAPNIVIIAVSLAVGIIPLAAPDVRDVHGVLVTPGIYHDFPSWAQTILGSGISAGALTAVLLNLVFNHLGARRRAAAAEHAVAVR
ncbi:nucleobase:cation symporter-2 family protein [Kitasatospora viridis]|uniref:Xanthine permease n=1 Tax=Kitasatospora viridis TaxID=281105 RepID=A0A561T7B9_9ACTN|nr:nucleobase:cation symporter-2 family protein [Kitasatospora viridis]TWF83005.1 xanthine permease [Kitasatospora viridis]